MVEAAEPGRKWESPRRPGVAYSVEELSEIATINDMVYPLDSLTTLYAAFPDGEICLYNVDSQLVTLLYRPIASEQTTLPPLQAPPSPVQYDELPAPAAVPPAQYDESASEKWNFCTNCGHKVEPDDLFCTNCGMKLN